MDYTIHRILQARIMEWVAFSFSRGSSQPRDRTQVSHIAGGFFTSWATREARLIVSDSLATPWTVNCQASLFMWFPTQEHWSGLPFPSLGDLPDTGIKPLSPGLLYLWATREAHSLDILLLKKKKNFFSLCFFSFANFCEHFLKVRKFFFSHV